MMSKSNISEADYQRKIHELELFLNIGNSIIQTLSLDDVLQIISDGMSELIEIETSAIYLLENEKNLFLGATTPPLDPNMPEMLRRALLSEHPNIRKAVESKVSHVLPDTSTVELSSAEKIVVEMRKLRSLIYLPFIIDKQVLGILILGTSNKARVFSKYEVDLCQGLANQLSLGIQNAKMHTELIQQNEELKNHIEEKRIVELALESSKDQLFNALKIAKLGHWEYDVKKDRFTFNDEFYELFGTTYSKIKSYTISFTKYIAAFVHPDDRNLFSIEARRIIDDDDPDGKRSIEHRILYSDGSIGHIAVSIRLVRDENGKAVKALGTNQDVTQRKQNEEKLVQALEKAKESDQLKSAFLANMSHEIRTPLNAILGFSQLLHDTDLVEELKTQYLDIIEMSGERLLNIITDILDISKIEAKQIDIKYEPCNLNDLIKKIHLEFSNKMAKKGLEFQYSLGLPDENSVINTDQFRLFQVLTNLVDNALKFTSNGSIDINYQLRENELLFSVCDSGIGIAKKDQELIFERFMQVDKEFIHAASSGNGLGLSIVKGIVELMNGGIWVESEINNGSQFYFTIPYEPVNSKEESSDSNSEPAQGFSAFNVLVAEDERSNYIFLEALFEDYNCKLFHAENGKEAVELFSNEPKPDFIVMDLKMPIMGGLEAIREIRKKDKKVPIIAQTAYAMEQDRITAIEAGCNFYITKPIDIINFKKVVSEILQTLEKD